VGVFGCWLGIQHQGKALGLRVAARGFSLTGKRRVMAPWQRHIEAMDADHQFLNFRLQNFVDTPARWSGEMHRIDGNGVGMVWLGCGPCDIGCPTQ